MDRRDFFGIIAAPLVRRTGTPPVAVCRDGVEQINDLLSVPDIPLYNPKRYSTVAKINVAAIVNDDVARLSTAARQLAEHHNQHRRSLIDKLYEDLA